jgi:hypothetical protein
MMCSNEHGRRQTSYEKKDFFFMKRKEEKRNTYTQMLYSVTYLIYLHTACFIVTVL